MVTDCLSYMPKTSSGVVVSHRSPRSLIANLITNKAAHSPSLPHNLLASKKNVRHTPTIVRPGLSVKVVTKFEQIDQAKLTELLEFSFGRELDSENYYERLRKSLDFLIISGDYSGAAIVTKEFSPFDSPDQEPIAYLDKFAVLPSLQGSGTVDFLWGALRDEVHGLGLLDALNDNGGKEGFGKGRELVWKSRADNPVNRWYYERSNGFVKINTEVKKNQGEENEKTTPTTSAWSMFWCDSEERISEMSGERKLKAEASREDVIENMNSNLRTRNRRSWKGGKQVEDQDNYDDDYLDEERSNRASKARSSILQALEDDDEESDNEDEDDLSKIRSNHNISKKDLRKALEAYSNSHLSETTAPTSKNSIANSFSFGSTTLLNHSSQRLLPIIAPEEDGRLQRWRDCMGSIPSAWK